jgi:hypothetical protein
MEAKYNGKATGIEDEDVPFSYSSVFPDGALG